MKIEQVEICSSEYYPWLSENQPWLTVLNLNTTTVSQPVSTVKYGWKLIVDTFEAVVSTIQPTIKYGFKIVVDTLIAAVSLPVLYWFGSRWREIVRPTGELFEEVDRTLWSRLTFPWSSDYFPWLGSNVETVYTEIEKPTGTVYTEIEKPTGTIYTEIQKPGNVTYTEISRPLQ